MGSAGSPARRLLLAFLFGAGQRCVAWKLGLCLASLSSSAIAQQLPAAEAPTVIPPRLKVNSSAAYPEQALRERLYREVAVPLLLEVDAEGRVRGAELLEPQGHGFDEAALTAAKQLVFEPATRDGRPIAARIKFRYVFAPPAPRLEETDVAPRLSAAPTASATAPEPESPLELRVEGERPPREVTRRTLGREEIWRSPGTMGDALLSLQNLPGVARPLPFSGALVVRGSSPADTLVHIDGTEVPLVYHFGGLSSVVPTELLTKIDFYPGNYSARFGRGMGGIVDAGLRSPKLDGYHGLVENSVLGFRLLAEGPLGNGWGFFVSGQRSWLDLLLPPLLASSGANTAMPRWADYQLALQNDFAEDSSFRVLVFGSDDAFEIVSRVPDSQNPTLGGAFAYHTSFWRVQGRFESKLGQDTQLRLISAYGEDSIAFSIGPYAATASLRPLSGRLELSQAFAPGIVANVGLDVVHQSHDLKLQLPPPTRPGVPAGGPGELPVRSTASTTLFLPAAFAELELVPWQGARVVPGLRVDYDSTTERWDTAPRLSMRQALTSDFPMTTLKAGVGLFHQPPSVLDTASVFGQEGLSSNRSVHSSFGFEQEFTREVDLSLDVFHKSMDRLIVPGARNAGSGFAYGAEWLLRYKPDARFFGWLSYTLSRSERRQLSTERSTVSEFDQTHVLTLIGSHSFGDGWQFGGRFRLTSGGLYTPTRTGAYNATTGSQAGVAAFPPFGTRLPVFHQLDLRIEKSRLSGHWRWTFFLDVQNVYFAKNPLGVSYSYDYTQSAFVNGLPILPIFGLRGELQ